MGLATGSAGHQINRMRVARKQAMKEHLSAHGHYQYFLECVDEMTLLTKATINNDVKDRFAMLSNLADKHWRVVDKYLPAPTVTTQQSTSSGTPSSLQAAVLALVQRTTSSNNAIVPTNMDNMPAHVEHEHGAHGDSSVSVDVPTDTQSAG